MSGGDTAPASMEPADADEITVLDEQDGKWSTSVIKSKEELEPSLNQARAATADQPVRKFNAAGVMHASAPRNARATAPNHNSPDLPESLPNFVHDSKLMKTQSASQSSELGDEQEPPEDHVLTTEKAGREHGQNTDFKTGSPDAELGGENTR